MRQRTKSKTSKRSRTKAPNGNGNGSPHPITSKNKWWKGRSKAVGKPGRPPFFPTPEDLRAAVEEYFEYTDETPLWEEKIVGHYKGEVITKNVRKPRPMTIGSLCMFLNLSPEGWNGYKERDGYVGICVAAEQTIREHKFAGVNVGFFNHAIIARDLGLMDRVDITTQEGPLESKTVIVLPSKKEEGE